MRKTIGHCLGIVFLMAAVASGQVGGTYETEGAKLVLVDRGNGQFEGALEFQGQKLPLTGSGGPRQLTGKFVANGKEVPFEAEVEGKNLRMRAAGNQILLVRQSADRAVQHSSGLRLKLAEGWTAVSRDAGYLLVPPGGAQPTGAEKNEDTYFAGMQEGADANLEAQLVKNLRETFVKAAEGGKTQERKDAFAAGTRAGTRYQWDLEDGKTRQRYLFTLYLVPNGTRMLFALGFSKAAEGATRDAAVRAMAESLAVDAVAVKAALGPSGALSDGSAQAAPWVAKLKGKVVRQFHNYSGMSSEKWYYLNADGTYEYRSTSMVSVEVPGASGMSAGSNDNTGWWQVKVVNGELFLAVRYRNGKTDLMPITQDAKNWFLNGQKAFAVDR